jgi:hypothetical protein
MFYQSQQPCCTRTLADALLAALLTRPAAALLAATCHVHLFVNNLTPNGDSVLGDFTEATFTGYLAQAFTAFVGPVHLGNGAEALMVDVNFIGGAITPPGQTCYGYYITDNTDATLYMSERFTSPVPFANLGDFLDLKFVWPEPTQRTTV